jgi:gamma-glutamylcysteine synthetase
MKKSLTWTIGAAILFSGGVALAQDTDVPVPGGKAAATPSMPMTAQMDEHMKKMQALHDRMMGAATPEERQKAMEESRKEMQDSMVTMKPMMQAGAMRGDGMRGEGTMGAKGRVREAQAQMQMMGKRVDMMQMMMQMMIDQQGMMAPQKPSHAAPKK